MAPVAVRGGAGAASALQAQKGHSVLEGGTSFPQRGQTQLNMMSLHCITKHRRVCNTRKISGFAIYSSGGEPEPAAGGPFARRLESADHRARGYSASSAGVGR